MSDADLAHPDAFSAELHFALMTEGLRGAELRRLMRLARTDAELGRIFEVKVSEYRRYLRSERQPTLVNWPIRQWERFSDNVRFTPPKEVVVTMLYVAVAMAGMELVKRRWQPDGWRGTGHAPLASTAVAAMPPLRDAVAERGLREFAGLEKWMIAELRRTSQSSEWRDAVAKHMADCLASIDLQPMMLQRLEEVIRSPEVAARISASIDAEINSRLADGGSDAARAKMESSAPPMSSGAVEASVSETPEASDAGSTTSAGVALVQGEPS
jgi:hypothetical protein